jgi:hypothetical protein
VTPTWSQKGFSLAINGEPCEDLVNSSLITYIQHKQILGVRRRRRTAFGCRELQVDTSRLEVSRGRRTMGHAYVGLDAAGLQGR